MKKKTKKKTICQVLTMELLAMVVVLLPVNFELKAMKILIEIIIIHGAYIHIYIPPLNGEDN